MSHRSSRRGSAAAVLLFAVLVVVALGALAAWTPLSDGFIGFLAVVCLAFYVLGGGSRPARHGRRGGRRRVRH